MRKLLTILAIAISATTFGQTAQENYNKGNEKSNSQDFAGSIKDYDKAIKLDPKYTDAYYNRGSSKSYLKDYNGAITDFDKAIELRPGFVNAFTNRGVTKLKLNDAKGAIQDFDAAIILDPKNTLAYFMRGQVKLQSGDNDGGCTDIKKAKELGDTRTDKFLNQYCGGATVKESLMLDWPESENWKVGDDQENEQQHVIDLIRSNETIDKWTELGNMTSIKGVTGVPMDKAMNLMFDQSKQNAPKAKLTFIEKDESTEYPWIIFTIEAPGFKNDKTPESQLWYIVQGKQALYTNFRAVKKTTIPPDLKDKWTIFFKTGKIVSQ